MKVLKKWSTYVISAVVSLILLLSAAFLTMIAPNTAVASASVTQFDASASTYVQENVLTSLPNTYTATVTMSKQSLEKRHILYSNYRSYANGSMASFEIFAAGNPRLYIFTATSSGDYNEDFTFSGVTIPTDVKANIAITFNGTTAICYINGEKMGEITGTKTLAFSELSMKERMVIGSIPGATPNYFKSDVATLHSVGAYSDVYDARKIAELNESYNNNSVNYNDSNLMFAYNFEGYKDAITIPDLSQKSNGLVLRQFTQFDGTSNSYIQQQKLTTVPKTYMATVTMEAGSENTRNTIFSNWTNTTGTNTAVTFEINFGRPRLYLFNGATGFNKEFVFDVNVSTGFRTKIAITFDGTTAICYIDGAEKQRLTTSPAFDFTKVTIAEKMAVGTIPYIEQSPYVYFHSDVATLHNVRAFSDVRNEQEVWNDHIVYDANDGGYDVNDPNLMFVYRFDGYKDATRVPDLATKVHNDIARRGFIWSDTSRINPNDYAFSFMVVGDTQIVSRQSMRDNKDYVSKIYKYIADTAKQKNSKFVFQVGDLTEYNSLNEWNLARSAISQLDGIVPYSLVRGNHDFPANGWWSDVLNRSESAYLANFGAVEQDGAGFERVFGTSSSYANQSGMILYTDESGNKSTLNTAQFFTGADNLRYLAIALDFGPTDHMLNWARGLIEANPNHNVIITTHGYMDDDNQRIYTGKPGAADMAHGPYYDRDFNEGTDMWNKLFSQYKNIQLIMCGHELHDQILCRQDAGVNGGFVTQMMINSQDVDIRNMSQPLIQANGDTLANRLMGMVATYYVSADGKTVDVEYYSPIQQKYFLAENQFRFVMDSVEYPVYGVEVNNDNEKGMISGFDPSRRFVAYSNVTFSVSAIRGYEVEQVLFNGNVLTPSNGVYTATILPQKNTLEVKYDAILYKVQAPDGVTVGGGQDLYDYGTTVSATAAMKPTNAEPNATYRISAIKVNGQSVEFNAATGAFNFLVLKDTVIEVEYKQTYSVALNTTGGGNLTIENTAYDDKYDKDSTIFVRVLANTGNKLVSVTVNDTELKVYGGKISFKLDTDNTVVSAVFEKYDAGSAMESFGFEMYGTAIRLYTSETNRYAGVQFRAVMPKNTLNDTIFAYYQGKNTPLVEQVDETTRKETTYFMGLVVIPRYVLGEGELLKTTPNVLGGGWHNSKWTAFQDNPDTTEDDAYSNGDYLQGVYRLYDLPVGAYTKDLVARSYIDETVVEYVKNDDGSTTKKPGVTTTYYTNEVEISMARVATNYVQNYEDSNDPVYSDPLLINSANHYRPDYDLIYTDGESQVRELAQWGDMVIYDSALSELTYSKTVFTIPGHKGYTNSQAQAQTFRGLLSGGEYAYKPGSKEFETREIYEDLNFFCLYASESLLFQKFDLETSRDSIIYFKDIPLDKKVYEVTFYDSSNKVVFAADSNGFTINGTPNGTVQGWDGVVHDYMGKTLSSFYNESRAALKVPKAVAQSLVDEFADYGDDKFSVEILVGSADNAANQAVADCVIYKTTGALCSMKIATEKDLYNWGKVAKTDYLNMMSNYATVDGAIYQYTIDAGDCTDPNDKTTFKVGKTKGTDSGEDLYYNDYRWGGYFVLADDIDCTEGNYYTSFIDVNQTNFKPGYDVLKPSNTAVNPGGANNWLNGRMYGFHGTFDGRGYNINNIAIETGDPDAGYAGGFVGILGYNGVIKNVSFTNGSQHFTGGFVTSTGCGRIENVYVHVSHVDPDAIISAGQRSGVFYGYDLTWESRLVKCFVNVTDDFASKVGYYTIGSLHKNYGVMNGVFGVGGNYTDKVYLIGGIENEPTNPHYDEDLPGVDYDVFKTYDALREANLPFDDWAATDFWTMRNGLPYPARLDVDRQSVVKADSRYVENALISNYWGTLSESYSETRSRFGYIDVDETAKAAGVTVANGDVTIPAGFPFEELTFYVRSAYSGDIEFTRTIDIVPAITEFRERRREYNADTQTSVFVNSDVVIDLSQYKGAKCGITQNTLMYISASQTGTVSNDYTLDSDAMTLTIDYTKFTHSVYGDPGVEYLKFAFKEDNSQTGAVYAAGAVPVVMVTQELNNALELHNWLVVAKEQVAHNPDVADHSWDGYFVLGNDITFIDETLPACQYVDAQGVKCPNYGTTTCNVAIHRSLYGKNAIKYDTLKDEVCTHFATDGGWITNWHDVANAGFCGTFDGYGHSIINYDSYQVFAGGFIGLLHTDGVLRNVNFIDAVFGGSSGFLTHTVGGLVENIYIELRGIESGTAGDPAGIFFAADKYDYYDGLAIQNGAYSSGGLVSFYNSTTGVTSYGKIRNCFARFVGTKNVNITKENDNGNDTRVFAAIGGHTMAGTVIDNVYMIGRNDVGGYNFTYDISAGQGAIINNATSYTMSTATAVNDFGYFVTKADWLAAGGADAHVGMGNYWTVRDGMPYPKTLFNGNFGESSFDDIF